MSEKSTIAEKIENTLKNIDFLKIEIDKLQLTQGKNLQKINNYTDILYTYESNKIEGNTLTLSEITLIINTGAIIFGKSRNEHLEVINHNKAIEYIRKKVKDNADFNENTLKDLHGILYKSIDDENAGFYRNEDIIINGAEIKPKAFAVLEEAMLILFDFYAEKTKHNHPTNRARDVYILLCLYYPFKNGNNRLAKLVMNFILLKNGYPITIICKESDGFNEYYNLERKIKNEAKINESSFFITKSIEKSSEDYLKLLK